MPGKGQLKLTGSLGDVMRESAEAARSWLRTHAEDFALGAEAFDYSTHPQEADVEVSGQHLDYVWPRVTSH